MPDAVNPKVGFQFVRDCISETTADEFEVDVCKVRTVPGEWCLGQRVSNLMEHDPFKACVPGHLDDVADGTGPASASSILHNNVATPPPLLEPTLVAKFIHVGLDFGNRLDAASTYRVPEFFRGVESLSLLVAFPRRLIPASKRSRWVVPPPANQQHVCNAAHS